MSVAAIIVAAGRGGRMGGDDITPKQLRLLGGKPVLSYSVEFFDRMPQVDCLCIVTRPELRKPIEELPCVRNLTKPLYWAVGGARRQDSTRNGLRELPRGIEIVAIHDAARPFPSRHAVERAIEMAREHGAAILAASMSDTVKRADISGRIVETLDRSTLWLAQTPQVFQRALLEKGFDAAEQLGLELTDEASALEAISHPPLIVPSDRSNFKITTPEDLLRAEDQLRRIEAGNKA
ncbi:MAG: 2-C-methyl-D-erythritol 4-phosphate cytidylyltransferase [Candidatus Sumerlaeota bacterium]|nr:2-C-methyl-D-erythritol 4-phosphate cytidylyltransferase [Candidatus Sumerlaeota bacterium]